MIPADRDKRIEEIRAMTVEALHDTIQTGINIASEMTVQEHSDAYAANDEFLARASSWQREAEAVEVVLREVGEPVCDGTFRSRLLRLQGISVDEIAQYVEAVEHAQALTREALSKFRERKNTG